MTSGAGNFIFSLALILTSAWIPAQATPVSSKAIELQCGQHKVTITCDKVLQAANRQDARQCNHNTLSFTNKSGKVSLPKQPKNFRQEFEVEKTPVSLACAQGKDGRYYVMVEFSACPLGVRYSSCAIRDLFASDGRRLTVNGRKLDSIQTKLGISYIKLIEIEGDQK